MKLFSGLTGGKTGAHQWRGVIQEYKNFLPVTSKTPIITLAEGGTPLVSAQYLSKLLNNISTLINYIVLFIILLILTYIIYKIFIIDNDIYIINEKINQIEMDMTTIPSSSSHELPKKQMYEMADLCMNKCFVEELAPTSIDIDINKETLRCGN